MKVSFECALAECIQHYVDRGNTVEQATLYMSTSNEEEVFRIYEIIQKEKEIGNTATIVNIIGISEAEGGANEQIF